MTLFSSGSSSQKHGKPKGAAASQLIAAFEEFPEALVLRDERGTITFLNRETEKIFQVMRDDIVGNTAAALAERNEAFLRSALMLSIPKGGEARFAMPSQAHTRAFAVSEIPVALNGAGGSALRIFRETTREEELSRLKTQFMSVTAHQLRTPISGLKWVIEMLLSGEVGQISQSQRELLQRAADTSERMIRLIGDLLDVTRIEEGRFAYHFHVEQNIVGFVERVVAELRGRAKQKDLVLSFAPPKEAIPALKIDPDRFGIALENIVENAINYTMKGEVVVTLELQEGTVAVHVRDTGIGIPKNEQGKITEKFFRAENAVRSGIGGTGLGLFIVRSIMEHHGGSMAVVSEEGKGTTVTLTLPTDPAKVPDGVEAPEDTVV